MMRRKEREKDSAADDKLMEAFIERCSSCIYRGAQPPGSCCNYILITGHMRGCPVIGCRKYEKGDKVVVVEDLELKGSEKKYSRRERGRRQKKSRYEAAKAKWIPPGTRIGKMIDIYLEKTGLTQNGLARELQISCGTLSAWRLKPQRIAKENMEKLAKVLNVPVEEVRRAVEEEKTT